MSTWKVTLFGKFNIEREEKKIAGIEARKVQELLSYLLIFRNHPQSRDVLSETLWNNHPPDNSKKYLRQTLWRLQSALKMGRILSEPVLFIDQDWIQFNLTTDFWLDIAEFEKTFNFIKGKKIKDLNTLDFELLKSAVDVYKGDLLEGWYQGWCIFERERFQMMHMMLLDKLVQFCELNHDYDAGLAYGMEILRYDHAYERAHRQLMRLYSLTGNRTQALHQYVRCVTALRDELGVQPSERTGQLYEQIRLDTFRPPIFGMGKAISRKEEADLSINDMLVRLEQLALMLKGIESQVQREIVALESLLATQIHQSSQSS
jgi:DNA-binding SARP family transcriptional activator